MIVDTHTAIWIAEDVPIKPAARSRIEREAAAGRLLISSISAWEIATLVRRKRLRVAMETGAYVRSLFSIAGLREAPVTVDIARIAGDLPESFHGDPADRIIAATAMFLGHPLATRDERMLRYARSEGAFKCVAV